MMCAAASGFGVRRMLRRQQPGTRGVMTMNRTLAAPLRRAVGAAVLAACAAMAAPAGASNILPEEIDAHSHEDGIFRVVEAAGAQPAVLPAYEAAGVVTRESEIDAIFGQQSVTDLLGEPIDIRFGDVVQIEAPDLLRVTTKTELDQLFGLTDPLYSRDGSANPVVSLYFVDAIDYCGGYAVNIVGCGQTPGNQLAVEKGYMSSGYGAELLAHELGHALGLYHPDESPYSVASGNLMDPTLNGDTSLDTLQVAQFMGMGFFERFGPSPLIQRDAAGWFVAITPYLIVDQPLVIDPLSGGDGTAATSAVPLPGSGAMMAAALLIAAGAALRRRNAAARPA